MSKSGGETERRKYTVREDQPRITVLKTDRVTGTVIIKTVGSSRRLHLYHNDPCTSPNLLLDSNISTNNSLKQTDFVIGFYKLHIFTT